VLDPADCRCPRQHSLADVASSHPDIGLLARARRQPGWHAPPQAPVGSQALPRCRLTDQRQGY